MATQQQPANDTRATWSTFVAHAILAMGAISSLLPMLMSLCIHLSTMLFLVWWMVPGREVSNATEPERRSRIVVATKPSSQQKTKYLEESPSTEASSASRAQSANPAAPSTTEALPSDESFELPANLQLPAMAGLALPGESFLPGVEGGVAANRRLPSGVNEAAILAEDARGRGTGTDTTGKPGGLNIFGAQARGRTFAMVIDRSASMGEQGLGAIRAAADELAKQLDSLDEQQRVQVVAYHAAPSLLNNNWLAATPENKHKLLTYLRALPAFGSTNHTAALTAALKLRPEVIFLITDGDDPGMDPGQLRIIRELARGRTSIHAIHFGRGTNEPPAEHFMRKLAADNGGNYVYVNADRLP